MPKVKTPEIIFIRKQMAANIIKTRAKSREITQYYKYGSSSKLRHTNWNKDFLQKLFKELDDLTVISNYLFQLYLDQLKEIKWKHR